MNLREYINNLNKFVRENPEALDKTVAYAKDDEGNGYGFVHYSPTKAIFTNDLDEGYQEVDDNLQEYNTVIIN